jgi:hypothetical protein
VNRGKPAGGAAEAASGAQYHDHSGASHRDLGVSAGARIIR